MTTETTRLPRWVAITSAGSGLGRAIAIGFADKGYRPAAIASNAGTQVTAISRWSSVAERS